MTSSQPDESDEWNTPTNKRSRRTQDGSSKDNKMAKSNGNWLNPTPIQNRFSCLQQEDDIVNQSTPARKIPPNPLQFISPMSLPSLHYFNSLIKSSRSFIKSKPWPKIRLKSNLNLLALTA
jgi:hypothetical protein